MMDWERDSTTAKRRRGVFNVFPLLIPHELGQISSTINHKIDGCGDRF